MTMSLLLQHFHFLRPEWLLAIIPAALITYFFWQQKNSAANWQGAISQQLLQHLTDSGTGTISRWPWLILFLSWLIAAIAMAGPSWQKLPQPIHQRQDALVIVMDLSLSMLAEDIKPSRLLRARHKVLDILTQRKEGLTALIAYSSDAHIVSPLTDDNATIANLTPALSPGMMPAFGSNPVAAITQAKQLFKNAGINYGRILLITDGISRQDLNDIDDDVSRGGFELSIMGIGSKEGAPIPTGEGFLKDNKGNIIIPQLQRQPMEQLAKLNNGRYTDTSLNDDDIIFLLPTTIKQLDNSTVISEREFDQWLDRGPLLVLLLLPLSLLAFRRGWLLLLPLLILDPQYSYAQENSSPPQEKSSPINWQNLWQRADQQAARKMAEGDTKGAAKQFKNQQWKGSAHYKSGNFKAAAENFSQYNDAQSHYNHGNALAKSGQLDQAIKAYDEALKQQPAMADALANKALLEQLKQKNEQEQEQEQEKSKQQNDESNNQQQDSNDGQQDSSPPDQQQEKDNDKNQGENSSEQEQEQEQEQDKKSQNQQQEPENNPEDKEASKNNTEEKEEPTKQRQAQAEPTEIDPEQQQKQQAMEQLLRKIPDDPSGLLRRKFNYEHQLRQQQGDVEREQPQW